MMQLKLGTKGEIVIPKKIREHLGLIKNRSVTLEVKDKTICISSLPQRDIAKEWEELAKKYGFKKSDLIYGDKLYEEIF